MSCDFDHSEPDGCSFFHCFPGAHKFILWLRSHVVLSSFVLTVLCLVVLFSIFSGSTARYEELSAKEFLFTHQNMRLSIDGGSMLDKNMTSNENTACCTVAEGRLLTVYTDRDGSNFETLFELILNHSWQRIAGSNIYVTVEKGWPKSIQFQVRNQGEIER